MFIEPVFGKKFFGREEVLGTLKKRVTDLKGGYRQNLALTGPMLAGKSSILRHFLKGIEDTGVIPLYVEMGDEKFEVFCDKFMASLLYGYVKSDPGRFSGEIKPDGGLEELKNACREAIPGTIACIDRIQDHVSRRKEDAAYEDLLSLSSVFKKESGRSCIVILDEFHNLSSFRIKKPFQTFGKFIMLQKNTMYIVSSSQKTLLRDILSRKLSLLFGNFEVIEIDGFDHHTSRSFISDRIKDLASYGNLGSYLIQISQGNPFYLEVLADKFSELIESSGGLRSAKECLLEAFAALLYRSGGVLNQYFTNNINFFLERKSRKKFLPILISLAKGNSTIKAIEADLKKSDKELGFKLKKLEEMDIILNSGIFYKVSDKVFEYWLRYVYSFKSEFLIDDMDIKYLEFKNSIGQDYENYCDFVSRGVVSVISELFGNFNNQKVKLRMDCRKMPRFDSVEHGYMHSGLSGITGRVKDKSWVCLVKQRDITEEQDIYDLWNLKKDKDGGKVIRKIFVPLKGIEQNAFLLAKEHNIWVWDVGSLNRILRLFGKFEIVL